MADESWRRQLVEERFGDSLTPGFARPAPAGIAADAFGPIRFSLAAPSTPPRLVGQPVTAATVGRMVAALVVIVAAAAIGWFARGIRPSAPAVVAPHAPPASLATPAVFGPLAGRARVADAKVAATTPAPAVLPPPAPEPQAAVGRAVSSPTSARSRTDAAPRHAAEPAPPARSTKAGPARSPAITAGPMAVAKPGRRPEAAMSTVPTSAVITPPPPLAPAKTPRPQVERLDSGASETLTACVAGNGRASRTLCDKPQLRQLDAQVQVAADRAAQADEHARSKAARGTYSFLRSRDRCRDDACLASVYTRRLRELDRLAPPVLVAAITPCRPVHRHGVVVCRPAKPHKVRRPAGAK